MTARAGRVAQTSAMACPTRNGLGNPASYVSYFAGGQIGNLRQPMARTEWDFADPACRNNTVRDLIGAIHEIIVPYFATLKDPASVLAAFDHAEMLAPIWAIEFAQAHFGRDGAERVGRTLLAKQPQLLDHFRAAVDLYRREACREPEMATWRATWQPWWCFWRSI